MKKFQKAKMDEQFAAVSNHYSLFTIHYSLFTRKWVSRNE